MLMIQNSDDIRIHREARGLSQSKLAQLLGVKQALLSAVELGKQEASPEFLDKALSIINKISDDEIASLKRKRTRHAGTIKREKIADIIEYLPPQPLRDIPESPTAISLFSGCGGMCLGFENAGFRVLGNVEINPELRAIYELNFPHVRSLGEDITQITNDEVEQWLNEFKSLDLLFGGPPCQGFSLAGKRNVNDPRNMLFTHMVRIAAILQPRYIVMENVRVLTSMKATDGSFIHAHITKAFSDIGYNTEFSELNVMNYGVPQFRERVIFIGVRKDLSLLKPFFPPQTHGEELSKPSLFNIELQSYRTFRDATGDLESLEPGEISKTDPLHFAVAHPPHVVEWLSYTPEGCSAHENLDPQYRPPSGYNTTYKRLRWDEPSGAIQTTFGMISASRTVHPSDTRSLTIREALRCQTFPDHFRIKGKIGAIRTAIGNAVPPQFAEVIGRHIKEHGQFKAKAAACKNIQPAN